LYYEINTPFQGETNAGPLDPGIYNGQILQMDVFNFKIERIHLDQKRSHLTSATCRSNWSSMYAIASLRLNSAPHNLQRNAILRHDRSMVNWPSQAGHLSLVGSITTTY
jgi:hypothetical protein